MLSLNEIICYIYFNTLPLFLNYFISYLYTLVGVKLMWGITYDMDAWPLNPRRPTMVGKDVCLTIISCKF